MHLQIGMRSGQIQTDKILRIVISFLDLESNIDSVRCVGYDMYHIYVTKNQFWVFGFRYITYTNSPHSYMDYSFNIYKLFWYGLISGIITRWVSWRRSLCAIEKKMVDLYVPKIHCDIHINFKFFLSPDATSIKWY